VFDHHKIYSLFVIELFFVRVGLPSDVKHGV